MIKPLLQRSSLAVDIAIRLVIIKPELIGYQMFTPDGEKFTIPHTDNLQRVNYMSGNEPLISSEDIKEIEIKKKRIN